MIDTIYTLKEVAKILKLSERTVYSYVRKDILKAFKIGQYWRISESQLKEFIDGGGTRNRT